MGFQVGDQQYVFIHAGAADGALFANVLLDHCII